MLPLTQIPKIVAATQNATKNSTGPNPIRILRFRLLIGPSTTNRWQARPHGRRSKRLGNAGEESPARSPLRRADADARAVADLILLVEQVDDVAPQGDDPDAPEIEIVGG